MANPNPKRNSLRLSRHEQALFDAHEFLVKPVARQFCGRYPGLPMDEVLQAARLGLCHAVKHRGRAVARDIPFAPFARMRMKWSCAQWMFGRFAGMSAVQNAKRHEFSASEETVTKEGEQITRGERAENKIAKREMGDEIGTLRLEARRAEMRDAIATLATLTDFERKVMRLRYVDGLERATMAKKLRCSQPTVQRATHKAVGKLRAMLVHQGSLPPSAPLPLLGDGG